MVSPPNNERPNSSPHENEDDYYLSKHPYQPQAKTSLAREQVALASASRWKLVYYRFKKHRLAVFALYTLLLFYLCVPFAEQIAPYSANTRNSDYLYAPPQSIHLFHEGKWQGPFVYPMKASVNLEFMRWDYEIETQKPMHLRFFCRGEPYKYLGTFKLDFHLVCPPENGVFYPLGTDRLGRDLLSGLIHGARLSLTLGLVGVAISMVLGVVLGGLAGYLGGLVDGAIQRLIEILRSLPELPLWMALSAAMPVTWSPIAVYLGLTVILGLLDWPGLARAVRAKIMALKQEDYAKAALYMGASPSRIIFRHLLPGFTSHLIASATLSIPAMILGETALSFLDLGLRRPAVSWGVLLNEAQSISVVVLYPWLMAPMLVVIIVVLAFNFLGDGLRDAADPYHH
ncbi:ABC transporter permease [Polycladidibacter stylochi]|uniref:ABC transporter permease n=1 Tax=Polycladidibacter stylochi TaxID=1807766 RepID=UPI0008342CD7|nr:ABC transporter permease [Pseudovibrio stylochi]